VSQTAERGAPQRSTEPGEPLLEVRDLDVIFKTRDGVAHAINGVDLDLSAGETHAVLGESGSGKSVTAQAIMGILPSPPGEITGGSIKFRGDDLLKMPEKQRRLYRAQRISMVFQDALSALNPVYTVGFQIGELFTVHKGMSRREAKKKSVELMERVRIPAAAARVNDYPHQFSGGMRQRIMIAMAIALEPDIIIADEPTTALDVTVQAQIMELLAELRRETGSGLILITHDLGVVAEVADRISVMYAGRVIERGTATEIFESPAHPYTRGLLDSMPKVTGTDERLYAIPGLPPSLTSVPPGCPFSPRCPRAEEICRHDPPPPTIELWSRRTSDCHFAEEVIAHGVPR
jgi:oligopeptide/dipeptide ABC transporter ATP-binding protein